MKYKSVDIILVLFILILNALSSKAAWQDEKRIYFDKWDNVASEELMNRAAKVMEQGKDMDSALIYYNIVYNRHVIDPTNKDKAVLGAMSLNNMVYLMSFDYYDYERAFSYLSQSIELLNKFGCEDKLPYVYVNLGNLMLTGHANISQENLSEALHYYKAGVQIASKVKDWDIMLINFNNMIGMTTGIYKLIDYDDISQEVARFDKQDIPSGTPMLAYTRQNVLVYKAMTTGRYKKAIGLAGKMLQYIPAGPDSLRYALNVRTEQASSLMSLHQYQEATNILLHELTSARNKKIKDLECEICLDLMLVSRSKGDSQKAEHYEYLYLKAKDEMLFGSHKITNVEQSRLIHQLNKANEEVKESTRRHRLIIIIAIVAIVFALTIAGFSIAIMRSNRRLKERNHKLYQAIQETITVKPKRSEMGDERRTEIIGLIENALADTKLLCGEDMSLSRLAEFIGIPQKQVSQVINEHWQKKFPQLLSEYRIREACRRMQDSQNYGNYTIEGIGKSVGFHTRSNFFATFKRVTGLTPTEFIEESKR